MSQVRAFGHRARRLRRPAIHVLGARGAAPISASSSFAPLSARGDSPCESAIVGVHQAQPFSSAGAACGFATFRRGIRQAVILFASGSAVDRRTCGSAARARAASGETATEVARGHVRLHMPCLRNTIACDHRAGGTFGEVSRLFTGGESSSAGEQGEAEGR